MPIVEPVDENLKELEGIHLWHAPLSSCSQRVRITLAEKGLGFISHLIDLHAGEHATEEYQRIHPNGLVPALVIDGELIIESVDIIKELERRFESPSLRAPGARLDAEMQLAMKRANAAQPALKLLTFEFLFRAAPPPPKRNVIAFQNNHKNDALKKFHRDFAAGFKRDRIVSAAADAHSDFRFLDSQLSDGRPFLCGSSFSLADIAWLPNLHRFEIIGWPLARYPNLLQWSERVKERSSYRAGLMDWEPAELMTIVKPKLEERIRAGDGVETYIRDC
jgi:glutathione S-transferase